MTLHNILIVDDDDDLRDALVEQLSQYEEFQVCAANTANDGVELAREDKPDLIIMDVGLPDKDGREAVKILRDSGFNTPIIMLTGHDSEQDTIMGLDAGANDYVVKPFRFAVLLARMRAQLRTHEHSEDAVFNIAGFSFRPAHKMIETESGQKIKLTEKEASIIKYLYRAKDKIVPREELLEQVWGYNNGVTTHTLETHIYRLRQKIEPDPSNATLLITESGGYRLYP